MIHNKSDFGLLLVYLSGFMAVLDFLALLRTGSQAPFWILLGVAAAMWIVGTRILKRSQSAGAEDKSAGTDDKAPGEE